MRIKWNDYTIYAFEKASEYTKFHEIIAQQIKPYVKNSNTLCDMGCGLALVDIYLSKYINNITCVDINEKVINYAKQNAKKNKIDNIKFLVSDFKKVEKFFDIILISFFSCNEIEYFSNYCKKLIVIVNNGKKTHVPVSEKNNDAISLRNFLREKKIKYSEKIMNLQFGQPFENEDEIREYSKEYGESTEKDKIFEYIIKNVQIGNGVKYYLPYDKSISMFIIEFDK